MKKSNQWRLNADVGEGCDDALIMPFLSCANVACAAHAGDESIIKDTLKLAKIYHVTVGAHPGYPDKENFGRHSLDMSSDELAATLTTQISLVIGLAKAQGMSVAYVKPHGALNHDMLQKPDVFEIICQVVSRLGKHLHLMVPTNANEALQQKTAKQYGLNIWWEVFADRAYESSGLLRPRKYPDALHTEPHLIIDQLNTIEGNGEIIAIDGSVLDISHAQTICIHGDNAPSVEAVQRRAESTQSI